MSACAYVVIEDSEVIRCSRYESHVHSDLV